MTLPRCVGRFAPSESISLSFPQQRESRPGNDTNLSPVSVKMSNYYVYILASKRNGTLYIRVTNYIERRVAEHKQGVHDGFTKKYGIKLLVHIEWFSDIRDGITREKQLKKWNRQWKLELIDKKNPEWVDLSTIGYNTRNLDSRVPRFREDGNDK